LINPVNDQAAFEKFTHDALAHLYDLPYLHDHPIARGFPAGSESPGRVLRRLILEVIQDLKPPPDSPNDSWAAGRYQFLYLRYIKAHSIEQIARELCLSERQLYRRQREALESVASALREKIGGAVPAAGAANPAEAAPTLTSGDTTRQEVRTEVDRLGAGRAAIPTDLSQVLRSSLATLGNLTRAESRSIILDIESKLPPVAADRVALRQAVLGLLLFAHESAAGTEIRASLRAVGSCVRLTIRLRGATDAALAPDAAEGSNLEVGRRLVELQRGSLTWQQVGDATTEIVASFPIARPRTILIVDDNTDTIQLFGRYLEAQAHRVLTASTGEEALRIITQERPDAVVLDVMLPSTDGYEVLQTVRGNPETAAIPIIVCTVLKQRELALAVGATDFLAKPATQGALLAALEHCWTVSD
jgi:CheY-like chemotaxis protein